MKGVIVLRLIVSGECLRSDLLVFTGRCIGALLGFWGLAVVLLLRRHGSYTGILSS